MQLNVCKSCLWNNRKWLETSKSYTLYVLHIICDLNCVALLNKKKTETQELK